MTDSEIAAFLSGMPNLTPGTRWEFHRRGDGRWERWDWRRGGVRPRDADAMVRVFRRVHVYGGDAHAFLYRLPRGSPSAHWVLSFGTTGGWSAHSSAAEVEILRDFLGLLAAGRV